MKKYLIAFFMLIVSVLQVSANQISKHISESDFELKSTVSVMVIDKKTDKTFYKKNEQKLVNPASVLKILTFGAAYKILGENYEFETALYRDDCKNLYIKLSGDTLLSQEDLNKLFSDLKNNIDIKEINNIYIDDTIFENINYPKSWMQEDGWPNQRAITPYIVDKNEMKLILKRSSLATVVDVIQDGDYKVPIINKLTVGEKTDYEIEKYLQNTSAIITLSGQVAQDIETIIPVANSEINFKVRLLKAINKNNIQYERIFTLKKVPANAKKICRVSHTIKEISKDILHNSDNFSAEVVFRVAGAKYINYSHKATFDDSLKMFNDVFKDQITDDIQISDASGVLRYNLLSSKFICNCIKFLSTTTNIETLLPTADEGTLTDRLAFLKDNIRAKTGTLSNVSSIAGTMKTKKDKNVVFCIIVQNSPKKKAMLKNFENTLIGAIYKSY